jgi:uncharacterized protein
VSRGSKITGAILILVMVLLPVAGYVLYKRAYYADHFSEELNTFFNAAATNDVKSVQKMLASGMPVDAGKDEGVSALLVAVGAGSKEVVAELLKHHPDLELKSVNSKKFQTWSSTVSRSRNIPVQDSGTSGETALVVSVRCMLPEIEQMLLAAGAKVKGDASVEKALVSAAQTAPSSECVLPLLDRGLKFGTLPNTGQTLLQVAVYAGDSELAQRALKDGVDADHLDSNGETALLSALRVHKCDEETLALLAARTHKLDTMSRDLTSPLHEAVKARNIRIVKILLERGAKPNIRDGALQTPLLIAARFGDIEICRQLIQHNADPTVKDSNGQSAIDIAKSSGYTALEKVLQGGHR